MTTVTGVWNQKGTTSATYSIDGKVVATLTGLPSGFSVNSYNTINGVNAAADGDTKKGTIQLGAAILNGSTKVSVASSNGYEFALELDTSTASAISFDNVKKTIPVGTTNNTLTITGDVKKGYLLAADGKSISLVQDKTNQTLAKLEKLNIAASLGAAEDVLEKKAATANVTISGSTITLSKDALADATLSLKSDYGYKLAIDSTVNKTTIDSPTSEVSNGKATIKGTLTKGYTLSSDGKTLTYAAEKTGQTLATVTGLGTDASDSNVNFDATAKTITLSKGALKNASVALKLQNGADYKLALYKNTDSADYEDNVQAPTTGAMEWTYNNGTATYQQITSEGWTLADDLNVTYSAKVTDTFATVKGLAKLTDDTTTEEVNEPLKAIEGGITVGTNNTLTITDPDLLTNTNVTVTAGKGHDAYTLKIGGDKIPKAAVNDNIWSFSGTTATFKNVDQAYYSEESNGSIKYNKEGKATVLATLKGIAKGATGGLKVTTDADATNGVVGVIKISKAAVGTTNITLGAKDNYTLEFDKDTEKGTNVPVPDFTGATWNLTTNNKGVATGATLNGDIGDGGFILSADGKTATYVAQPKNGNALITITGTLNLTSNDTASEYFSVDETGVITVKAGALGTSNLTIKNAGFRFAFDSSDTPYTDESSDVKEGIDVWRISGTTATYKKVIPAYYTINDKGAIVYHKETDVKNSTYATVKGLKKGLEVNGNNKIDGIELNETTGVITLSKSVLAETNATLTPAKDSNYTLELATDVTAPKPQNDVKWTASGTTATLKGNVEAGWNKNSDTLITYSKAVTNGSAVLATVKGLNKNGLADTDIYDKSAGTISGLEIGTNSDGDAAIVVSNEDLLGTTNVTIEGIGGYKLALGSKLQNEDDTTTSVTTDEPSWDVNGTTANYRKYTSPGFTVADDGATLVYSADKFGDSLFTLRGLKSGITRKDLEGYGSEGDDDYVAKGVEIADEGWEDNKGKKYPLIKLSESVLGDTNVTFTNSDTKYANAKIDLAENPPAEDLATNGTPVWTVDESAGTAYLRTYTPASYTVASNGKSITYKKASDRVPVATITGLDTKALKNAVAAGNLDELLKVEVDKEAVYDKNSNLTGYAATGTGVITVDDSLLSKNTVTITNEQGTSYDYKLKLADVGEGEDKIRPRSEVTDNGKWSVRSGTATYTVDTTLGYYIPNSTEQTVNGENYKDVGTSIVYNTKGTLTTKISGLSSSASDNDVKFEAVEGGDAKNAADRTGKILISENALGSSTIKLTNPKGYNYTLALDSSVSDDKNADKIGYAWVKAKNATKATFQKTVDKEKYSEGVFANDGTALTYYKAGSSIVGATLNGLSATVTAEQLNAEDNAYISVVEAEDGVTGTITILSRDALGTGNVTIANKDNYNLVLSSDADFTVQDTAAGWNYDATKSGKVTLVSGKTAGWTPKLDKTGKADGKTILYTKPNLTTLATINGLVTGKENSVYEAGLTFSTSGGTITVNSSLLNNKNVTLGNKDAYSISISNADDVKVENIDDDPYWEFKNGKATLIGGTTEGYTQKDSKTISYVKQVKKTLATISGLVTDKYIKDKSLDIEIGVSDDGKFIGLVKTTEDEVDGKTVKTTTWEDTPLLTLDTKKNIITIYDSQILGETTAKLAPAKGTSYALALAQDSDGSYVTGLADAISTVKGPEWVKDDGKTTATYQQNLTVGYSLSSDRLSIVYTNEKAAEKPTVLATLSGLVKAGDQDTLKLNDEGTRIHVTAPGEDGSAGTILIKKAALIGDSTDEDYDGRARVDTSAEERTGIFGTTNISLANKDNYTLAVESEKAFAPTTDAAKWELNSKGGTAIYKQATSEGWTKKLDGKGYWNGKALTYSKAADVNLATVSGLVKNSKNDDTEYYQVKENDTKTVQALADKDSETYVDLFSVSGRVITFDSDATLDPKSKVTVKSGVKNETYTLAVNDSIAPEAFGNPKPYLSGTTVTLKNAKTAGWVVDEKTSTTLSKAGQTSSDTVATITGLKKGIKSTVTDNISFIGKQISIPEGALGTTDIVLTDESNSGYTFYQDTWITKGTDGDAMWDIAKGSAVLSQEIGGGYAISTDGRTISYTDAKSGKNANLVTISGLNKNVTTAYTNNTTEDIYYDAETKTITVNNALLTNGKVTAKSADKNVTYKFALGEDVVKAEDTDSWKSQTEWATAKGTATYKTYDKPYYSIEAKTGAIAYNKESKGTTYMTVSGLATADSIQSGTGFTFNETAKTITIDDRALNKKNITLKINDTANYSDYKLAIATTGAYALGNNDSIDAITETLAGEWTNGATAKLTGTITAGYSLTNDKTITYLAKNKEKQTIAQISGLSSGSNISDSDGVISLSESDLNKKDVVLTTSLDNVRGVPGGGYLNYRLELSGVGAPVVSSGDSLNATWTTNKTKAVLKGRVREGYILSASEKSVTYTKDSSEAKNPVDLVTINGLKTGSTLADSISVSVAESRKLTLNGGLLDSKVTITGGVFEVSINNAFNNSSLVGSATADSISIAGSNVTVNTGKGDDYVYLGGSSNTFIYGSGEGNDVVADFTAASDKIKVVRGTVTSVETVAPLTTGSNDVLVKVDGTKGSIRLKGAAGSKITILDAKDNSTIYTTTSSAGTAAASGRLLESDNFTTTTPQPLSDLVNGSGSDYTLGNLDTTQDVTNLDKQSDVITYSGDK